MKVENPAAFRFIMQDDVYLLNADKQLLAPAAETSPVTIEPPATPVVTAPPVTAKAETPAIPSIPTLPVIETRPETVTPAQPQPVVETQNPAFNYLGKNQKQFLVLVHYPAHPFMTDAHQTALESTLNRKGLGIDDVAILNVAQYPGIAFKQIKSYFLPTRVLALGKEALPPGLPLKLNSVQTSGPITALFTFSFEEMMSSNENKKAFWEQVKNF